MKKFLSNKKIVLVVDILLLLACIFGYEYIYETEKVKTIFTTEAIKFVEENANPVFRISKIILYSSAHVVDNSENKDLKNIDISQFSDIAIYVDNTGKYEELTPENTVNELYIDNIDITINSENGEKIFNYKNPKEIGKYVELENYQEDGIIFNIANSNDEQIDAGYAESVFFTDCSNPISLGFINKNLLTNCTIGNINGEIVFDGSILKNANIDLESISGEIDLSIHIKNNLDEDFICNLKIENDFEDVENGIYSGYVMKIINANSEKYNFLKISE